MAFNGNLHEFGIVALLQLPNTNRLTGRLTVDGPGCLAEFFYNGGKLIHATCGETIGKDVLTRVIDWDEGKFAFESDVSSEDSTITGDLHHSLMWALKERDERKQREAQEREAEEERRRQQALEEKETEEEEPEIEPVTIPSDVMATAIHASFACVADFRGRLVAVSEVEDEYRSSIRDYLQAVCCMIREYPEAPVGKTFIDDKAFSLGLCGDEEGYTTVLFAAPNTRLGILSMELGKFMSELKNRGFGEQYEGKGQ